MKGSANSENKMKGYGRKLLRMAIAEIRAAIGSERKIRIQAIPFDKGIYKSRLERFYRPEGLVVMKKEKDLSLTSVGQHVIIEKGD